MPDSSRLDMLNSGAGDSKMFSNDAGRHFPVLKHFFNPYHFVPVKRSTPFKRFTCCRPFCIAVSTSGQQGVNGSATNTYLLGNVFRSNSLCIKLKNRINLIGRQLGKMAVCADFLFIKAGFVSVCNISGSRYPFEILNSVIGFISVNVIDFVRVGRRIPYEHQGNKSMDIDALQETRGPCKINVDIARRSLNWLQFSFLMAIRRSSQTLYLATFANCVNLFPPWNVSPARARSLALHPSVSSLTILRG